MMKTLTLLLQESSGADLNTALPYETVLEIQGLIRKGAKDLSQKWKDAIQLTDKAYQVAGVHKPTPDMRDAWKQYLTNLEYSVQWLSRTRGLDGDWRLSAFNVTEAAEPKSSYRVHIKGSRSQKEHLVSARNMGEIIDSIKNKLTDHEIIEEHYSPDHVTLRFHMHGIKSNLIVNIAKL